jgi:hypothetical protein
VRELLVSGNCGNVDQDVLTGNIMSASGRNHRSSVRTVDGQGKQCEDAPCADCNSQVKDDDEGLQCNLCGLRHHRTCEDVSAETYQLMMSDGGKVTVTSAVKV